MSAFPAVRARIGRLAPDAPDPVRPYALARIDDARINVATEADLVEAVIADAIDGVGGTVFTLNLDHLVKLREDQAFRAAYQRASYVTADGLPVVVMARRQGVPVDRVTGADLVEPLCAAAARAGIPVYLFGTRSTVLDAAAATLAAKAPGLVVAGATAPPMGFDPFGAAASEAAEAIEASGARICFVALGAPKQELFANAAMARTTRVIYVCIGAALDFQAGAQVRAPRLLSDHGLEWLWRLAHDPRRLTRRYVRSGGYFLRYLGGSALTRAGGAVRTFFREITRDVGPPGDRRG